ncbi:MAG: hypothetical protein IPJ19_09995 [Planctomycetes bacterium]|nr:hypothetical protein [Planctomycetota bacterium]
MKLSTLALLACLALLSGACATSGHAPVATGSATAAPAGRLEKTGTFVPSGAAALSIWPEQYSGALLVLDAKPAGTAVAQGDVIATLDTRAIDEELHKAELEAQSASVRHQGVLEHDRIDESAARSALDLARAALERTRRSLEGWQRSELAFQKRGDEIQKRQEQARVEDETDELDQLEKMYKADALVDATEDIVLKRSRRSLELTKTSTQLSRDRSSYREALELALQTEQKEEQARTQAEALERLVQQQAIDARARADAQRRSAEALRDQQEKLAKLRRDREMLALRAPRAGVLLHGSAKDYRPGRTPPRYERGSMLAFRQDLFLVADPAPSVLALDLAEAELAQLAEGAKLVVSAGSQARGSLHVDPYARANGQCEASVTLEAPLTGALYGSHATVHP